MQVKFIGERSFRNSLVIDVDRTIADSVDYQYDTASVIEHAREYINKWVAEGWHITIHTARYYSLFDGNLKKIYERGYMELKTWLDENGFSYHEIVMGKPNALYYLDNHAWRIDNKNGPMDWNDLDSHLQEERDSWHITI